MNDKQLEGVGSAIPFNLMDDEDSRSSFSITETPSKASGSIEDDLRSLISSLNEDDYRGYTSTLIERLTQFEDHASFLVTKRRYFGRQVRNEVTEVLGFLLNIIKEQVTESTIQRAEILDLSNKLADINTVDPSSKDKVRSLEHEVTRLEGRIEGILQHQAIQEDLFPKIAHICHDSIASMVPNIEHVCRESISSLKQDLPSVIATSPAPSYAQVVASTSAAGKRRRQMTRPPKPSEGVLIIRPKNKDASNLETNRVTVRNILHAGDPNLQLCGMTSLPNGGIKLISPDAEGVKKAQDLILNNADFSNRFDISTPKRRSPQIILYGVDEHLSTEELTEGLIRKNPPLSNSDGMPLFTADFKIPARRKGVTHWVLSVHPDASSDILDLNGLFLCYERLKFKEFFSIKQCGRCLRFGHTSRQCADTLKIPRCHHCGDIQRDGHDCRVPRCFNCLESNSKFRTKHSVGHSAFDKACKCYLRQKDLIIKRTDYGS